MSIHHTLVYIPKAQLFSFDWVGGLVVREATVQGTLPILGKAEQGSNALLDFSIADDDLFFLRHRTFCLFSKA